MNSHGQKMNPISALLYGFYFIGICWYQIETIGNYLRNHDYLQRVCTRTSFPSICNVEQERFITLAVLSLLSLLLVLSVAHSLRNKENYYRYIILLLAIHFTVHLGGLIIYLLLGGRFY